MTVTSWLVYKCIRDLESIYHLCITPIHRIGIIHKWSIDSHWLKWSVLVDVLLNNCKQNTKSQSLLAGRTVRWCIESEKPGFWERIEILRYILDWILGYHKMYWFYNLFRITKSLKTILLRYVSTIRFLRMHSYWIVYGRLTITNTKVLRYGPLNFMNGFTKVKARPLSN